jgi:hypothetical protein
MRTLPDDVSVTEDLPVRGFLLVLLFSSIIEDNPLKIFWMIHYRKL